MPSTSAIRAGRAFVELFADNSKLKSGLRAAERQLKDFGKHVRDMGLKLIAVGSAVAAPMVAGAKVFADFEEQMANVATMLDKPEQHMDRFRAGIRELAMEFGESTGALAKGLYDILSASVAPSKALDVLAVSVKAAKAGLTDTGVAADAITTILNAYGLAAGEAGRVSDVLFGVVRRGKTTFAELAPSIGMVISTAASAGVPLEEVGAVLATLTRNGVQTENAVTALNSIIMQFLKPSADAVKLSKELGFEMNSATIHAEGLAGVFQRISKLPPDAIAKLFPDARALRGVIPALQNLQGFSDDIKLMAKSAGMTDAAYRKMAATLSHTFAQVKATVLDVLIAIGQDLAEPIRTAAESIKRWARWVGLLVTQNAGLIVTIAKTAVGVIALGGVLVAVGTIMGSFAGIVAGVSAAITATTTVVTILGAVIGALATPIGAIIAGVIVLAAVIIYATGAAGKAVNWLGEQFSFLEADARKAWKGIGDALAAGDIALAAKILWLTLKLEWTRGSAFLKEIWAVLKYEVLTIVTDMIDGVRAAWEIGVHAIGDAWYGLVDVLRSVWSGFTAWFKKTHDAATTWVAKRMLDAYAAVGGLTAGELAEGKADLDKQQAAYAKSVDEQRKLDDKAWDERMKRREDEHRRALADISEENRLTHQALENQRNAAINAADEELRKAIDERNAAIREAKEKRKAAEAGQPAIGTGPEELQKRLPDIQDTVAAQADKFGAQGTFNAEALLGLQAGGPMERMAGGIEKIEKNTRPLKNATGLAFT